MIAMAESELNERDAMRSFLEGARKSASCARELAATCDNKEWIEIANMLDALHDNGYALSRMKAMTKTEIDHAINLKMN